ncbi:MAG: GNAT family N-acetyltransferase [Acidimicrobiales bacterium]
MHVRLAVAGDAEAVADIWNNEVLNSTHVFELVPRSTNAQERWLAEHAGAHPAVVAVDGSLVLGFASLSPYHSRPAYAGSVEDSVYVGSEHRAQGVGRALLEEVVRLAGAHGFHTVIARIADHNQPSVSLHRSAGFDLVGVEHEVGRKFGRWLDVAIMQLML